MRPITPKPERPVERLLKAKAFSDAKQYDSKHLLMRKMLEETPDDFVIDSQNKDIIGLTHTPTGFQMHLPKKVIAGISLKQKQAGALMRAGEGLPQSATEKMPSLSGVMKTKFKRDTKSKKHRPKTPWEKAYPITAKFNLNPTPETNKFQTQRKQAGVFGDLPKYLGYSPGLWYDEKDNVSQTNRMRFGNLLTGVGLSGLGLAAVPLLQYLFPKRFEGKGTALGITAVLAGMSAPWLVNFPHTVNELHGMGKPSNKNYTQQDRDKINRDYRGVPAYKVSAAPDTKVLQNLAVANKEDLKELPGAAGEKAHKNLHEQLEVYLKEKEVSGSEKKAYIPLGTPIPKMHLADVASEQLNSGYIDYGQAAGLMRAAAIASQSKPWFTVGDLARAAVGAGAGAIAGTAAAKGIGLFMNLRPTEQKVMQGTGAALGTLINLGKLSF